MIRRLATAVCAAALAATAAGAAAQDRKVTVTVYGEDLAFVQEERTLDLPRGRTRVEFQNVSAAIRPETVALGAPGVRIVEQNFDFDLLTPAKLMEKAVGSQVRIIRTLPDGRQTTETATVLSVNQGVVLQIGGRVEVLREDDLPTRVVFDRVPENLRARPTLSVTLDSDRAGPRTATLSYLSTGLEWRADYVMMFDEGAGAMDLQGWITLTNTSGSSFENVTTRLFAGDVGVRRGFRPAQPSRGPGGSGGAEPLGDYYVYTLEERTTLADRQTKQVSFLDARGAGARKVYAYRSEAFRSLEQPENASVSVQFVNAASAGLGAPLPGGTVRVYIRDQEGEPKFVGQNRIEHAPGGSELSVRTGRAFDVSVQPTLVSMEREARNRARYAMTYTLRNARPEPVTVELRQTGLRRDGEVVRESHPSRRVDADTLGWSITVPAGGEVVVTATIRAGA